MNFRSAPGTPEARRDQIGTQSAFDEDLHPQHIYRRSEYAQWSQSPLDRLFPAARGIDLEISGLKIDWPTP